MINRILIYNSGGGIGDAIQIIPLINSLKNEFKKANFFYLCAHQNHLNSSLKDFNCTVKTLDFGFKYFGFRWWHALYIKKKNVEKFDLIIDLQSKLRNSLILKIIPHKYFISSCLNFKLSKPQINIEKSNKINNTILNAVNYIFKTRCSIIHYNTNNIEKKFFAEAEKLLPKNNYVGFSITQGNIYRKKEWPLNNIITLCSKLRQKNKTPVFFIKNENKELKNKIQKLIPDSLFPEHESNLSSPALVTCLGKRLDFAVSIDNGIMHMLSLAKVPMISLFGPTDSEKFAPEYKNSIVLDSKKLNNTKDISSIAVKDVLSAAKQLNF
jgi:ADP-heptose:LPS heptosyltransferase